MKEMVEHMRRTEATLATLQRRLELRSDIDAAPVELTRAEALALVRLLLVLSRVARHDAAVRFAGE